MEGENTSAIEKELALTKKRLEIIRNVSAELNKLIGLASKLNNILEILDQQFGIRHSMILMPNNEQEILTVFASRGYPENHCSVAFGKGIAGIVAQKRKPVNITGLRRKMHYMAVSQDSIDAPLADLPGLQNAESQIAIPLLANNELVAILMAESLNSSVFNKEDEIFLLTLTTPIAVSIQNSMLYDTMEEKIQIRTAELEKLSQTKDKLFSIISHDLRSPVTSFQSVTQLLRYYASRDETDKIAGLHDKIEQSSNRLNFLLDNLLNWSLSQGSNITCHFEKIFLGDFFEHIIALYQDILTTKNITIICDIEPDIQVLADENTLSVIFRNLLSNAIKFTPRNGQIIVKVEPNNDLVNILVSDNGTGMNEQQLKTLFTLSEKKSTIGTEKEKGTGLGLVLVNEFVQLNHGKISVESAPNKGTTFLVELPKV